MNSSNLHSLSRLWQLWASSKYKLKCSEVCAGLEQAVEEPGQIIPELTQCSLVISEGVGGCYWMAWFFSCSFIINRRRNKAQNFLAYVKCICVHVNLI